MLALYHQLITLRRGEPALEIGRFEPVESHGDVLAYVRRAREAEGVFLVALNLGAQPQGLKLAHDGRIALSTHLDRAGELATKTLELRGDEGVVVRLG
jgi:alpha-glucosidase